MTVQTKSFKELTEAEFTDLVKQYAPEFGEEVIKEFLDYWTEPGVKKMKFQYEQTWETHRRLMRWLRNKNKYRGAANNNGLVI